MLAFVSTLLALGVVEIAMRFLQPGPVAALAPQIEHVYVARKEEQDISSDYFYMVPNQTGYHYNAPVSTNSLGIRNREIYAEKLPNEYRIIALGDSHTFGFAVPEDQTWPRQLAQEIGQCWEDRTPDVINGGILGLSLEQEIELFRDRLLSLQPDLVIVAYYWNDMPHELKPFGAWPEGKEMLPSTMLRSSSSAAQSGKPPIAATSISGPLCNAARSLLKKSYLLYYAVQKVPMLQMAFFPSNETTWKQAILTGKRSPRIEASWKFVENRLVELKNLGRENQFDLMVLVIPLFEQMTSPSLSDAAYQGELKRIGVLNEIPIIDPLPAIQAAKPAYPDWFIPFDGHPNGRIYAIIAQEVSKQLKLRGPVNQSHLAATAGCDHRH